jgi:hypothetical protein
LVGRIFRELNRPDAWLFANWGDGGANVISTVAKVNAAENASASIGFDSNPGMSVATLRKFLVVLDA